MREQGRDLFGLSVENSHLGGSSNKNSYFRLVSIGRSLMDLLVAGKRVLFWRRFLGACDSLSKDGEYGVGVKVFVSCVAGEK